MALHYIHVIRKVNKLGQNKGHFNQFQELLFQQENGGNPIIPFDEIVNTTKASFARRSFSLFIGN